ncbi:hypothetical protein EX895_003284 [Sporisorium graminicola]|uniref:Uncharacterized protein n=1 Tax=Sporisorium graminicola TaxID=280036 RepID=A0A4U7KTC4_9BASI|nr:hypothetical protein EX895_003284 [Sporisorium graminicola]TKY87703.1 hypothetical protein EX895_003284 [Sporisorium graminicola]
MLELSPLGPLPSPIEEERENDRFTTSTRLSRQSSTSNPGTAANGRKVQRPSDIRATRADADDFQNALDTSRRAAQRSSDSATYALRLNERPISAGGGYDDRHALIPGRLNFDSEDGGDQSEEVAVPVTAEELRVDERDKYWRCIERGKAALLKLCSVASAAATGSAPPEIRVVAAKPNGHDRREGFQDFYCQAQHEPFAAFRDGGALQIPHLTSTAADATQIGCWADADVFLLVRSAPFLSFKTVGGSDGGWYWTGELPRETFHPPLLAIPSQIAQS